MRKVYEEILKTTFRETVVLKRSQLHFTQAKMAELLEMSERSYSDLENGLFCCSAVTLMLYLTYCCDDVQRFVDEMKRKIERAVEDVA
ncbi:MAG: helix-turn-helix domain-containing protein [Ruminococcus sp.]|nr:helix-turn-helix domain-containing protein [Ruminococcus sp.]